MKQFIEHRTNINRYRTKNGEVVIYEDHRTILNVLFNLQQEKNTDQPFDLIMFDNHDDFCHIHKSVKSKAIDLLKEISVQKLYQFVEFELNPLDDDWVTAGMELNLIGNVFLFNSDESSIHFREGYETKNFGTKYMYNLGNVWHALGDRGFLNDRIKEEYQPLWDDFGWDFKNYKFHHNPKRQFVIDFDLDCFTTQVLEHTIPVPKKILFNYIDKYTGMTYHQYYNSRDFIIDLIRRSELTTMCYENGCCGGIRNSHKIFNIVDELFFDFEIGG